MDLNTEIRKVFRVKRRDILPFTGWRKSNRTDITVILGQQGLNYGAEIGVQAGLFSEVLCKNIPNIKLICVDPWKSYGRRVKDERGEQYFAETQDRLKEYDVTYMRMPSQEAAKGVPDGSLDFVYIDGMHDFDNVMIDIIKWTPKVRVGGLVFGHDYEDLYDQGIVDAVRSYTRSHCINEWYVTRQHKEQRTWLWVKT